jgi:hypothetical protein
MPPLALSRCSCLHNVKRPARVACTVSFLSVYKIWSTRTRNNWRLHLDSLSPNARSSSKTVLFSFSPRVETGALNENSEKRFRKWMTGACNAPRGSERREYFRTHQGLVVSELLKHRECFFQSFLLSFREWIAWRWFINIDYLSRLPCVPPLSLL